MGADFVCSKCRYFGEGMWSQCAACELREHIHRLEGFKDICRGLLLALGPLGDEDLALRVAQAARAYHREHWGSIALYDNERLKLVRERWGHETDV